MSISGKRARGKEIGKEIIIDIEMIDPEGMIDPKGMIDLNGGITNE